MSKAHTTTDTNDGQGCGH